MLVKVAPTPLPCEATSEAEETTRIKRQMRPVSWWDLHRMHPEFEVARLVRQIELEHEAAKQALTGFSQMAKHQYITARMERIAALKDILTPKIGEEAASKIVMEVLEREGERF
jgi:hypothetical protein